MGWIRIDKSDGAEEPVLEQRVIWVTGAFYKDVEAAIAAAKAGADIQTDFAVYRWKPQPGTRE